MTKSQLSEREMQMLAHRGFTIPDPLTDAFTGEVFQPRAHNHYEKNDGIPVAPQVEMKRPTIRQRVENLLNRGVDPLAHYVGAEGLDMDIPDDPDAPLTNGEMAYMDVIASQLAEEAPLPDDGLPRPPSPVPEPPQAPQPDQPGVSSPPAQPLPPTGKS